MSSWADAGQATGASIWRVERGRGPPKAVGYDTAAVDAFYEEDSYIILSTTKRRGTAVHAIHVLPGKDERWSAAAVALVPGLESALGSQAKVIRETQGAETPQLLAVFNGDISYKPGGHATGLGHGEPKPLRQASNGGQNLSPAGSGTLDGTSSPARSGSPAPGSLAKLPPGRPASLSNLAAAVGRSGSPVNNAAARPGSAPRPMAAPAAAPSTGAMVPPAVLSTSETSNTAAQPASESMPGVVLDGADVPTDTDDGKAAAVAAIAAGSSAASAAPLLSEGAPATTAELAQPAEVLATGPSRNGGAAATLGGPNTDRAAPSASSAVKDVSTAPANGDLMLSAADSAASAAAAHEEAPQSSQDADLSSTLGERSDIAAPAAGSAATAAQPPVVLATDEQESGSSAVHVNGVNGASQLADREPVSVQPQPVAAGTDGPEGKLSAQPAATVHADSSKPLSGTEAEGPADAGVLEAPLDPVKETSQDLEGTARSPAVAADARPEPVPSVDSTPPAASTDDTAETSAENTFDGTATAASPGAAGQLQGRPIKTRGAVTAPAAELERVMRPDGLAKLQNGASPEIIDQPLPGDATVAIAVVGAGPAAEIEGAAHGVPLSTETADGELTAETDGGKLAAAQAAALTDGKAYKYKIADQGSTTADASIGAQTADLRAASANGNHVDSKAPLPVAANGGPAKEAASAASTNGNKPADGEQADTAADLSAESTGSQTDVGASGKKVTPPASPVAAVTGWFSSALSAVTGSGKANGQPAAAPEEETQDTAASSATVADKSDTAPPDEAAPGGDCAAQSEVPGEQNGDISTDTAALEPQAAAGPEPGADAPQPSDSDASAVGSSTEAAGGVTKEQPTKSEASETAPASPVPGSIAAKIAKLRAGAAARSPDAPPPKFGLRLPFVTADSQAVGHAAAVGGGSAAVTSAVAEDAGAATVEAPRDGTVTTDTAPAEPPAVNTTASATDGAGDDSAVEAAAPSSPAKDVASDSAAAGVSEGKPSPSPVRLVAQQMEEAAARQAVTTPNSARPPRSPLQNGRLRSVSAGSPGEALKTPSTGSGEGGGESLTSLASFWETRPKEPEGLPARRRVSDSDGPAPKRWEVRLTPFATRLVTDMAYLRSARGAPPESPKAVEPEFKHKPGSVSFPYDQLKGMTADDGINPARKETYLSEEDFVAKFGKTPDEYTKLAKWRQELLKKKVGLF